MTRTLLFALGACLIAVNCAFTQIPASSIPARKAENAGQTDAPQVTLGDPVPVTAAQQVTLADPVPVIESRNQEPVGLLAFRLWSPSRFWGSAEYLLWWTNQGRVPPLVTASPPGAAGILGPDTVVLFGGSRLDNLEHSGGRFVLGGWVNDQQTLGLEASYFFLNPGTTHFAASSNGAPGTPVIARPFFDANTNSENSQLVAFPGLLAGQVAVNASSRLQGWEGLGVRKLYDSPVMQVQALFGFRYLELNEGLGISEDLTVLPTVPGIGGTTLRVLDQFDTANRFYGGVIGIRGEYWRNNLSLRASGKIALGDSHQVVNINGSTLIASPALGPTSVLLPGGLLALPSNIGRYQRDEFAYVPELGVNLGYRLTPSIRATVGYTLLYYSNVARPGDQINRVVNPSQLPISQVTGVVSGPAQPTFLFRDTDFWAQGINFGLEFRY